MRGCPDLAFRKHHGFAASSTLASSAVSQGHYRRQRFVAYLEELERVIRDAMPNASGAAGRARQQYEPAKIRAAGSVLLIER
jgi:hypothetical protein